MRVVEMIWGIPFILKPPIKQISRHPSCPTICRLVEPNVKLFVQNLDLRWKFPTSPLGESIKRSFERSSLYLRLQVWDMRKEKKRKINKSKIEEKQEKRKKKSINQRLKKSKRKEKKKRSSLNTTMSERCVELSERKKIVTMTWLKPEGCVEQSPS